ncbi:MAG: hypothetical protein MUF22_05725 [Chitinispirillaceae bacterium]|jgi:hypothetical protein|nr:hypothetical protein [Chitinispirillaceae bacterium]
MPTIGGYKNVFDDKNEFNKLQDCILAGVQEFSEYRKGNLTYGEVMYVMECVLDTFRGNSEKDAHSVPRIKGIGEAPTFTTLLSITSRLVETLVKKGAIGSHDETFILHGEE